MFSLEFLLMGFLFTASAKVLRCGILLDMLKKEQSGHCGWSRENNGNKGEEIKPAQWSEATWGMACRRC